MLEIPPEGLQKCALCDVGKWKGYLAVYNTSLLIHKRKKAGDIFLHLFECHREILNQAKKSANRYAASCKCQCIDPVLQAEKHVAHSGMLRAPSWNTRLATGCLKMGPNVNAQRQRWVQEKLNPFLSCGNTPGLVHSKIFLRVLWQSSWARSLLLVKNSVSTPKSHSCESVGKELWGCGEICSHLSFCYQGF